MSGIETDGQDLGLIRFRLCVRCFRAVPTSANERYCINDGTQMLERCPMCNSPISNPYARYCATCGLEFAALEKSNTTSESRA
jgi:predicted RNA-binding Zn-ribbon protein involved in translation (DUF1610 family)